MAITQKKFIHVKAKNKRLLGFWLKNEVTSESSIAIITKRLVDKATREIKRTEIHYSVESAFYLQTMLKILLDDPDFKKENRKEISRIERERERVKGETDCKNARGKRYEST